MNRILSILGGLIIVISVFVPFAGIEGIKPSMWESGGFGGTKGPCYMFIGMGVAIMLVGLVNKRWLNIINILLALAAAGLGAMLYSTAKEKGLEPGIGIWMMIIGGVLALIGAIMGMGRKKVLAVA